LAESLEGGAATCKKGMMQMSACPGALPDRYGSGRTLSVPYGSCATAANKRNFKLEIRTRSVLMEALTRYAVALILVGILAVELKG
jgi:hypothetical protein